VHLATDVVPLFRYFVTVGTVLTVSLFALNAYLEPVSPNAGARVSVAPTTASLVYFASSPKKSK
jgi:hypothetical protein